MPEQVPLPTASRLPEPEPYTPPESISYEGYGKKRYAVQLAGDKIEYKDEHDKLLVEVRADIVKREHDGKPQIHIAKTRYFTVEEVDPKDPEKTIIVDKEEDTLDVFKLHSAFNDPDMLEAIINVAQKRLTELRSE